MRKCDRCGNDTRIIYVTDEWEFICDVCYDKDELPKEKEKLIKYFQKSE
jgi:hypothetical protein